MTRLVVAHREGNGGLLAAQVALAFDRIDEAVQLLRSIVAEPPTG